MGTLVEEVQFSEDEEDMVDIEATNVSYERLGEENAFLKNMRIQPYPLMSMPIYIIHHRINASSSSMENGT